MRYLGEYVIPIAAIILVLVAEFCLWEEIAMGGRLVRRFIKRMLVRREDPWER
jgi:hypothetical protein